MLFWFLNRILNLLSKKPVIHNRDDFESRLRDLETALLLAYGPRTPHTGKPRERVSSKSTNVENWRTIH